MTDIERKLVAIYDEKKKRAEDDCDARRRALTANDPIVAQLETEQRQRFAHAMRDALKQTPAEAASLKKDIATIRIALANRISELKLPADYLSMRYECDLCKDTGYLGDFSSEPCRCRKLLKTQLMREAAGITAAKHQTFENFSRDIFKSDEQYRAALNAKGICERYVQEMPGGTLNLVLMGESGLGKTFLLNGIADCAIGKGIPALMMTAFHMFGAMRSYHFGENGEGNMLDEMINAELLLIDDLGSEPMMRNITIEYLFNLLNERMIAGRHTAIATNLSPEQLKTHYGERVLSRLFDRSKGEFIQLRGSDLRYAKR